MVTYVVFSLFTLYADFKDTVKLAVANAVVIYGSTVSAELSPCVCGGMVSPSDDLCVG